MVKALFWIHGVVFAGIFVFFVFIHEQPRNPASSEPQSVESHWWTSPKW